MIVNVLVSLSNRNIDKEFSYFVPRNLESKIQIGVRVLVPFATMKLVGFVLGISNNQNMDIELKEIIEVIDTDVILTSELLKLGYYLKEKTLSTLIFCYQAMLPNGYKASNKKKVNIKYETYVYINDNILKESKLTSKQEEVIYFLNTNKNVTYTNLLKKYSSTKTLINKGILKKEKVEVYRINQNIELKEKYPLTKIQQRVVSKVKLNESNT